LFHTSLGKQRRRNIRRGRTELSSVSTPGDEGMSFKLLCTLAKIFNLEADLLLEKLVGLLQSGSLPKQDLYVSRRNFQVKW
jgi:hypothetical protein